MTKMARNFFFYSKSVAWKKLQKNLPALSGMAPGTEAPTAHLNLNRWLNIPLHCLPTHEHTLQECPSNTFFQKPSIPNTLWKTERERTWTLAEPWSDHPPAPKHIHHPHAAEYGIAQTKKCLSQCGGSFVASSITNFKKYIYKYIWSQWSN